MFVPSILLFILTEHKEASVLYLKLPGPAFSYVDLFVKATGLEFSCQFSGRTPKLSSHPLD